MGNGEWGMGNGALGIGHRELGIGYWLLSPTTHKKPIKNNK